LKTGELNIEETDDIKTKKNLSLENTEDLLILAEKICGKWNSLLIETESLNSIYQDLNDQV